MSVGERTRRAGALGQVIDAQMMLSDKGMDEILVNLDGFNRAMLDWARLMEVQNPEQYFLDPQSDASQQAIQQKDAARQKATMERRTLMQQAFQMEQLRIALGKYDGDADRILEYFKAVLNSEVEEAKIVGKATTELVTQQRRGEENVNKGTAGPGIRAVKNSDDTA